MGKPPILRQAVLINMTDTLARTATAVLLRNFD
jgi:hypothetical protein